MDLARPLTDQLAEQAWADFQAIETNGGFVAAGEYLAGRIDREEYLRADPADLVVQLGTPSPRDSSPPCPMSRPGNPAIP